MKKRKIGLVVLRESLSAEREDELDSLANGVAKRLRPLASAGLCTIEATKTAATIPRSDNRGYSDAALWGELGDMRKALRYDHIIAITDDYLERGSFNRQSPDRTCGVVTLAEWRGFLPAGLDQSDYLTYLVCCVVALQCSPQSVVEHRECAGCLFDVCVDRSDLTRGLRAASVEHCHDKLIDEAKWSRPQVEALARIVATVRRRDPFLYTASKSGAAGPFLIGVALSLAGSVVAGLAPRLGAVIAGTLLGASLWLVSTGLASRWMVAQRRSAVIALVFGVSFVLAVGAGAVAGAIMHMPKTMLVKVVDESRSTVGRTP